MSILFSLSILASSLLISSSQQASAEKYIVSEQKGCESLGGTFGNGFCDLMVASRLIINEGDTAIFTNNNFEQDGFTNHGVVIIEEGVVMYPSFEGHYRNDGTIINNGHFSLSGTIESGQWFFDTILNDGLIQNNGLLSVGGGSQLSNSGIIENKGTIQSFFNEHYDLGAFNPQDTRFPSMINNSNELYNLGTIKSDDTIFNSGIIHNHGTIDYKEPIITDEYPDPPRDEIFSNTGVINSYGSISGKVTNDDTIINHCNGNESLIIDGNSIIQLSCDISENGEPVQWINAANVKVTGDNIKKKFGTGQKWNAGAISSKEILSGNGFVEITATETDKYRMFGLSKGDTNQHWTDLDYGIHLQNNGKLSVYEKGVELHNTNRPDYAKGDKVRVEISGPDVLFKINGNTFHHINNTITKDSFPLLLDTSMRSPNSLLKDGVIGIIPDDVEPERPIEQLKKELSSILDLLLQLQQRISDLEQKVDELER